MNRKMLPSLSIFFPAYNEEENIAESVTVGKMVATQLADQYEIIVVDDGSSDATAAIADKLSALDPEHVRAVHQPNLGYGGAVLAGLRVSRYEYIFFTDADLQFDLREIAKLAVLASENEVVIGYRSPRRDPFMRKVNAWGWNALNRALFSLQVKDIDCAFKLFHRRVLHDPIVGPPMLQQLRSQGAMLSAELLIRLHRAGFGFKEVAVTHLPRRRGSPTGAKPKVILRALLELWLAFWGDLGLPLRTRVLRFGSVGVLNTAIDVGLYTLLTRFIPFFSLHILVAKTLSFLAGSVFSLFANRSWTFSVEEKVSLRELLKFYATVGTSVVVNVFFTYLFVSVFGFYDLIAVILATGVTFIWNFVFMSHWVFLLPDKKLTLPPL